MIVLVGSYDSVEEENLQQSGYKTFLKKPFDGGTTRNSEASIPFFLARKKYQETKNDALDIGFDLNFVEEKVEESVTSGFSFRSRKYGASGTM